MEKINKCFVDNPLFREYNADHNEAETKAE